MRVLLKKPIGITETLGIMCSNKTRINQTGSSVGGDESYELRVRLHFGRGGVGARVGRRAGCGEEEEAVVRHPHEYQGVFQSQR